MGTIQEIRQEIFNRLSRFALSNRRDMKVAMPGIFRDSRFRPMAIDVNDIVLARGTEQERIVKLMSLAGNYRLNFEVRK